MRKKEVFNVTFTAIMISLSCAFELMGKYIPFLTMQNGGSVSLSMLPIAVCAVVCGFWWSLACGVLYGILNCFIIDAYGFYFYSFFFDYIFAFGCICVVSLFRKQIKENKKIYFVIGFLIALFLRWMFHGFSGVINATIWGYDSVFLEGVFGEGKGSIIYLYIYSFIIYNLPYLLVSGIVCIVIALSAYKVLFLNEYFEKQEM